MDDEFPHLMQAFIDDAVHKYDMPVTAIDRLTKVGHMSHDDVAVAVAVVAEEDAVVCDADACLCMLAVHLHHPRW